jgi:DNA invertase Pin-like site-specific DNA recombinase
MKLTRYIRPTARRSIDDQIAATEQDGISITIIEGDMGRTFKDALKQLKPGNGLLIENFATLGRRRDTVCDRVEAIFDKRANIVDAEGDVHEPKCRRTLIKAIKSKGITVRGGEPKPRVPHNKISDEDLEEAKKVWSGKKYRAMTNKEVSEAVGISVVTLTERLGKRGIRKPGRLKSR